MSNILTLVGQHNNLQVTPTIKFKAMQNYNYIFHRNIKSKAAQYNLVNNNNITHLKPLL